MAISLSQNDPHSYSNPEQCIVTDIHLQLEVDFNKKVLTGFVDLSIEKNNSKADLVLDTKDLSISSVRNKNNLNKINYVLDEPNEIFGTKLTVKLPKRSAKKSNIRIEYQTSPKSPALEWLEPEQTSGKKQPFLFTSSQPIFARSFFPCQDSPAVKTTYSATIIAPYELSVLMSALEDGEEMDQDPLMKKFNFIQKNPVPSCLFVLVVGALEKREIGPRSHVWAEKQFIEEAVNEFSETEKMIAAAEEIVGDYVWEKYDILVLPPSFQYGGIESPCITFVTPALLAGDKSLASCIVHEIAHSWIGNLVTQKNYEHIWLNEGLTQFLERKIIGRLQGEPNRHLSAIGGWMYMEYMVDVIDSPDNFTKLVPDLKGINPEDAFSTILYEKGHTLMYYLETLLGGADIFDKFLKAYIEEFNFKSIDTETWKTFLYKYFSDKEDVLKEIDWDAWLYSPGMPPIKPKYDYTLMEKCKGLCDSWINADENDLKKFSAKDLDDFSSNQIRYFLTFLLQETSLPLKKIEKMDEMYKFIEKKNSHIRFRWIRLGLLAKWKKIIPSALEFINEQGCINFLRPIYRDLYEWEETREKAISNFKAHSKQYMRNTMITICNELNVSFDDVGN